MQKQFADECGPSLCAPTANTTYPFTTDREAKSARSRRQVTDGGRTDVSKDVQAKGGMAIEAAMFLGITGFFVLAAIIYTIFAGAEEPVGVVALTLSAGLTLIIGTFLLFAGRRLEGSRPEDRDDAEVADGAGDLGFFSPGSYWPFALALSAAVTA